SKFWQQESRSYKPRLTPAMIVAVFAVIGAVFIPIGVIILHASSKVVEIVDHYDSDCVPANFRENKVGFIRSTNTSKTCIRKIIVRKLMKSPVFVYYELHGFHQNHLRETRYAKDKSNKQLRSKAQTLLGKVTESTSSGRMSFRKNSQAGGLIGGAKLNATKPHSTVERA
ncbi:hypothetical protein MKW98_011012, partial [Papaver atlanticum]